MKQRMTLRARGAKCGRGEPGALASGGTAPYARSAMRAESASRPKPPALAWSIWRRVSGAATWPGHALGCEAILSAIIHSVALRRFVGEAPTNPGLRMTAFP